MAIHSWFTNWFALTRLKDVIEYEIIYVLPFEKFEPQICRFSFFHLNGQVTAQLHKQYLAQCFNSATRRKSLWVLKWIDDNVDDLIEAEQSSKDENTREKYIRTLLAYMIVGSPHVMRNTLNNTLVRLGAFNNGPNDISKAMTAAAAGSPQLLKRVLSKSPWVLERATITRPNDRSSLDPSWDPIRAAACMGSSMPCDTCCHKW
jgi:hypothetical protein